MDTPDSRVVDLGIDEETLERVRELYAAELTFADRWIGKLLNKLDDLGLADNTVVIYLSDHGLTLGEHGIIGKSRRVPERPIHHVPYMIRDPERQAGGRDERVLRLDPRRRAHAARLPGRPRAGADGRRGPDAAVRRQAADARAYYTACYQET